MIPMRFFEAVVMAPLVVILIVGVLASSKHNNNLALASIVALIAYGAIAWSPLGGRILRKIFRP